MTEHIEFTHLHTHTPEGSLLDGFMRIEKAVAKIKSLGMDALGVSDHGTMAAHYKFNEICKREGIHPVFGCCMPGQMIYTKKGVIPIEDVKVGDYVLTHKGNYKKVLRHWGRKYTGKIYGLNQLSNETVWLTGEHPVLLKKHIQKRPYFNSENKMEWVRADEILADNNYIEIKETRSFRKSKRRTVHEYYTCFPRISGNYKTLNIQDYIENDIWREKDNEIHKVKKYNKFDNTVQYNTIPSNILLNENFAKLLGYFTAEGSFISGRNKITGLRFTFNINEVEYHNEVKYLLEEIFGVNVTLTDYPERSVTEIFACSIPLAQFFECLTGNGARNKYISSEIFTSPKSVQKSFIEGLENGDGKITKDRVTLKFASRNLTYGVKQLLANLGYGSSVRKTINPLNGKRFEHYYTEYAPNKEKWVYTDRDEDYIYFPLKNVETKDYNGLVYNFEVEDDNSYVTDIVLHNCEGYITWDKSFKKEDFEKVNIEIDNEGEHIFAFMQKEKAAGSWMPISYFPTKKRQQEIERLAKSDYYPRLYEESFADPAMIPQKKTAYNKGMNALVKSYKEKGYELCIKADTSQRDFFEWFPWSGHLLLIAKNNEGYQNLLRLNNIANLEGFYHKPRFDYEDIKKYGKGIVCTTACMGSPSSQLILKGKLKEAKEEIMRYVEAFDEVYLELQPSRNPDQWTINNQLIEWSKELDLPLIVTTDAHMVDKEEMELHETMTNIGRGGGNYSEDESDISAYDSAYLMTQEEILENGIPREALQNAYNLSHRCQVSFLDDVEIKYPEYDVPEEHTFGSYLEQLAWSGLMDLFLKKDYIKDYDEYQKRLAYELSVIEDKGLAAYFIIVWDYIKWAREQGIYIGFGRGSAAGSLVSLCLGITNLDPIRYKLLFSRFLNPERKGFPDVDTDFSSHRRHEVINYLQEKYGENHVSVIGTYQTMTSKAILRDVGRVMGVNYQEVLEWNKNIPAPNGNVMAIEDAVKEIPIIIEAQKKYPQVFELASELQEMPKSSGVHPCGHIIVPDNLIENVPLMPSKENELVTQYEGGSLENLGYIKFDILGVKVLSILEIAVNLVEERTGNHININELEFEDLKVFQTIKDGNTQAIFQLSSEGMKNIFMRLNKVDFESLIAGISLYRPGPMQFIDQYIARANGEEQVSYLVPELEDILKEVFGLPIYQENIMQMTQVLGGYTEGQADSFRKAIGFDI